MLGWADKAPADVDLRNFDATAWLALISDVIASFSNLVISPSDLTAVLKVSSGTGASWTFSNGTIGTTYTIGIAFTTQNGLTISRNVYMSVNALTLNTSLSPPVGVVAGPPGPSPSAAQIQAALNEIPFYTAGYPEGGFWINQNGVIALAPVASMQFPTNPNLLMTLSGSGLVC
jgi:hypothetical protein